MRGLLVALTAVCVSCTLLVDTSGLEGGAAKPGTDGGTTDSGLVPNGEGGASTGAFDLVIAAAGATIAMPGGNADVTITVARRAGFVDAVNITLADNTLGLMAAPIVIDAASSSAKLTISAAPTATVGDLHVDIRGAAGSNSATAPLGLHVGGASGTLDVTYGTGGLSIFQAQQGAETHGYRVSIQPDGLPVVGGGCIVDKHDYFVARTLFNGMLDPSFANGGKLAFDFGGGDDYGASASVLPDGRIILAGAKAKPPSGATASATLIRLSASGKRDNTFGGTGETDLEATGGFDAAQYAWPVNGKLLVAGSSFFVARYSQDGQLDTTYGQGGKVRATVGSIEDVAFFSTVLKDGGIVLSGYTTKSKTGDVADHDWAIARFTADGKVDTSFGTDGVVTLGFGTVDEQASEIGEDSQGRLVVAGKDASRGIITRLTPTGQVDTTFGQSGYAVLADPNSVIYTAGLLLQGDRIILAGGFSDFAGTNAEVSIVRLDANGALDRTFGTTATAGSTILPLGPGNDYAFDIRQAPNGYLYVVGDSAFDGVPRAFIARLWP